MGAGKSVTIIGRRFATINAAKNYFQDQRPQVKASGLLTEGELYNELKDLYTRYCNLSPGWELNGRNITAFSVDYELRNNGQYAQHLCYKVHFSNKEVRPFSVPKALSSLMKEVTNGKDS